MRCEFAFGRELNQSGSWMLAVFENWIDAPLGLGVIGFLDLQTLVETRAGNGTVPLTLSPAGIQIA